jgi:hypothetical protein
MNLTIQQLSLSEKYEFRENNQQNDFMQQLSVVCQVVLRFDMHHTATGQNQIQFLQLQCHQVFFELVNADIGQIKWRC